MVLSRYKKLLFDKRTKSVYYENMDKKPTSQDLLDMIEHMDPTEVRRAYYAAIQAMQARMQSGQDPFK
jgi:hypothetical protein